MNKRGQMYVLAAVLLCIAIYSVMEVTNKLEMPVETNFDFYVENFKGERAYVVDLGILQGNDFVTSSGGLLDIFSKFGWGRGIIFVEYKDGEWIVTNYLGQDILVSGGDEEEVAIPSATTHMGGLSFEMGKVYIISESPLSEIGDSHFKKTSNAPTITISFDGNDYNFEKPIGDKIESIIFQNIDKNYVKVVKL